MKTKNLTFKILPTLLVLVIIFTKQTASAQLNIGLRDTLTKTLEFKAHQLNSKLVSVTITFKDSSVWKHLIDRTKITDILNTSTFYFDSKESELSHLTFTNAKGETRTLTPKEAKKVEKYITAAQQKIESLKIDEKQLAEITSRLENITIPNYDEEIKNSLIELEKSKKELDRLSNEPLPNFDGDMGYIYENGIKRELTPEEKKKYEKAFLEMKDNLEGLAKGLDTLKLPEMSSLLTVNNNLINLQTEVKKLNSSSMVKLKETITQIQEINLDSLKTIQPIEKPVVSSIEIQYEKGKYNDVEEIKQALYAVLESLLSTLENNEQKNTLFNIYPNPASNVINIAIAQPSKENLITVFDSNGKKLKQFTNFGNTLTLTKEQLGTGTFIIELKNKNTNTLQTQRVVLY